METGNEGHFTEETGGNEGAEIDPLRFHTRLRHGCRQRSCELGEVREPERGEFAEFAGSQCLDDLLCLLGSFWLAPEGLWMNDGILLWTPSFRS
jgi:hypothetical protein